MARPRKEIEIYKLIAPNQDISNYEIMGLCNLWISDILENNPISKILVNSEAKQIIAAGIPQNLIEKMNSKLKHSIDTGFVFEFYISRQTKPFAKITNSRF